MLILAGVSLNATIGDNGIITQAQNATYMQSIAALEEYLQTEYVKYYDETENYTSKIELLSSKLGNLCLKDGTKNYITYDGKMYYLINKQALPDDVKNQLRGGDTTDYLKYIRGYQENTINSYLIELTKYASYLKEKKINYLIISNSFYSCF